MVRNSRPAGDLPELLARWRWPRLNGRCLFTSSRGGLVIEMETLEQHFLTVLKRSRELSKSAVIRECGQAGLNIAERLFKGGRVNAYGTSIDRTYVWRDEDPLVKTDRLLGMPASEAESAGDEVHDFLLKNRELLLRCLEGFQDGVPPIVLVHAWFLIKKGQQGIACSLLEATRRHGGPQTDDMVDYLQFVCSPPTQLEGRFEYKSLHEVDLFLGACYYGNGGQANRQLRALKDWNYVAVQEGLTRSDGGEHPWRDFKGRGLQPRIAERAFADVYDQIEGSEKRPRLRDLNEERVMELKRPWTVASKPILPPADFEAGNGQSYDVKSNVYYPSHRQRIGLRGFLIRDLDTGGKHGYEFPGFIFVHADNDSCSWVYLGTLKHRASMVIVGDRVLPFYFERPARDRFFRKTGDSGRFGPSFLDSDHAVGWWLAGVGLQVPAFEDLPTCEWLVRAFLERCARECRATFMEYALWTSLTETTVAALDSHPHSEVKAFLQRVAQLLESRALPVRIPKIHGKTLLGHWIDEVLEPVAAHWSDVNCPQCHTKATRQGVLRMQFGRVTSQGTIEGQLSCMNCGFESAKTTLLTHCHECGCYPLIIGSHEVCGDCEGLICRGIESYRRHVPCGKCKPGCSREASAPTV